MPVNPYSDLPAEQFWRKAVASVAPFAVDPRPHGAFAIARTDRVATAGSCFAQRVAQALRSSGFNYTVTEQAPAGLAATEAEARQFGTYTARYGNLYLTRQFTQLFDRAFGRFEPQLTVWQRADGRFVDPFRPTIEPAGFESPEGVAAARETHLAAVRQMFETLDVFVVTLGLTEGFRHRADGAALPLAPGVAGGSFDPDLYEFVNVGVAEVTADLRGLLDRLWSVNPAARVILTVSPVPLVATYVPQNVLISNTYSKAVLRAAAGDIGSGGDPRVVYFPSFDLITANVNAGRYYAEDQRSVTDAGVRHVMRCFLSTFAPGEARPAAARPAADSAAEFEGTAGVICDEEQIERSVA
ncbi:GSCFA domain-containing protein [Methylobacterium durans]|uniref:GSCFA domain-containing protein n=1 Tax=Methylobacterium durans TaxID=2202825 RepID=UPI002AFF57DD|nr:GSCFA domain-containing protein [Methylobacterium durans]MEA1830814.1 GSCFA domain-containing protein [Methylobacterium durans]